MRRLCCIHSFDYFDFDVFLNIFVFYRLAGFRISRSTSLIDCSLLVVLRGIPQQVTSQFHGDIHVYDYVKEIQVDYREFYPHARSITYISLSAPLINSSGDHYVYGFLPVIPSIWTRDQPSKTVVKPVHISNFKPMELDFYQKQLLSLIHSNRVTVYGSKWSSVSVSARPISYLKANHLLASSFFCFGLMYPYQRGTSLSGRMWQAPLHGCLVISELGTNIFNCPGVLETSTYELDHSFLPSTPSMLALEARFFWHEKTLKLADDLTLTLYSKYFPTSIIISHLLLIRQHIVFLTQKSFISPSLKFFGILNLFLRRILKRILILCS
jgi:hypothetical protein